MRIGFFTECYHPIVNGVVASIDALRAGLEHEGISVTTIAPRFPRHDVDAADVVRLPSLPLPTATGYRLCVPVVRARDRERMRGFDVVHVHSPFVTGWMGAAHARRRGLPLVFTYHTRIDEYAHYAPFERRTVRNAMTTLTRRFANAADAVVVPTKAMEARLREIGVRAPIAVVPSSIDVGRFAAGRRSASVRALLGATESTRVVLAVARLGREKNLELAVDAMTVEAGLQLAIVGDGPRRAALEARAAARGVAARVRFVGPLAPALLPDVYASCDAFVFPSVTETQGLVLAEAMASGLPVVAVDAPATRDVLAGHGRIVPAEPAALAAALRAAVAAPQRDAAAAAAAAERFGTGLQTARMLELYRRVAAPRGA